MHQSRGMRLTTTMTMLGLVVASGIACQAQTPRADDFSPQRLGIDCPLDFRNDGAVAYDCTPLDEDVDELTPAAGPDLDACVQIDAQAQALIARQATCTHDAQCDWTTPGDALDFDPCLPALQCYLPVTGRAHGAQFVRAARDLDAQYRSECGICPVATCAAPDYVLSTCEDRACQLDVAMPPTQALTD